jgi:hypothetical protein
MTEPKKTINTGNRGKGRPKGAVNKITADVRALAQQYGAKAIKALSEIMDDNLQPGGARVAAAKELLDRAYGKSPQPLDMGGTNVGDLLQQLIAGLPN